jgi:hypothetical protein
LNLVEVPIACCPHCERSLTATELRSCERHPDEPPPGFVHYHCPDCHLRVRAIADLVSEPVLVKEDTYRAMFPEATARTVILSVRAPRGWAIRPRLRAATLALLVAAALALYLWAYAKAHGWLP